MKPSSHREAHNPKHIQQQEKMRKVLGIFFIVNKRPIVWFLYWFAATRQPAMVCERVCLAVCLLRGWLARINRLYIYARRTNGTNVWAWTHRITTWWSCNTIQALVGQHQHTAHSHYMCAVALFARCGLSARRPHGGGGHHHRCSAQTIGTMVYRWRQVFLHKTFFLSEGSANAQRSRLVGCTPRPPGVFHGIIAYGRTASCSIFIYTEYMYINLLIVVAEYQYEWMNARWPFPWCRRRRGRRGARNTQLLYIYDYTCILLLGITGGDGVSRCSGLLGKIGHDNMQWITQTHTQQVLGIYSFY